MAVNKVEPGAAGTELPAVPAAAVVDVVKLSVATAGIAVATVAVAAVVVVAAEESLIVVATAAAVTAVLESAWVVVLASVVQPETAWTVVPAWEQNRPEFPASVAAVVVSASVADVAYGTV